MSDIGEFFNLVMGTIITGAVICLIGFCFLVHISLWFLLLLLIPLPIFIICWFLDKYYPYKTKEVKYITNERKYRINKGKIKG